ncbi:MAG: M13 family peptidase, partial [Acidobacteriota bacterium]
MPTFRSTLALAVLAVSAAANAQNVPSAAAKTKAIDPANFDVSAKPCDDFYQYTNGAWLKAHPIPADRASYGSFQELSDRNREVLKRILEETSAKTDWPTGSNEQKVGDFYAAGMDEAAIEKAGTRP